MYVHLDCIVACSEQYEESNSSMTKLRKNHPYVAPWYQVPRMI